MRSQVSTENPTQIHATREAAGFIPASGDKGKPITVFGTNSIRAGFDATCLQRALNARRAQALLISCSIQTRTPDTASR